MTTKPVFRQYVVLKASQDLLAAYRTKSLDALKDKTLQLLSDLKGSERVRRADAFAPRSAPSLDWVLEVEGHAPTPRDPQEVVVSYDLSDADTLDEFRQLILANPNQRIGPNGEDAFLAIGADPGGGLADHWCPGAADLAAFGRRADARRVLGVDALPPTRGTDPKVNVVIIDQGLNREAITATHPNSWGGGWRHGETGPGSAERTSHGMLVARNVLDIAPDAVIYDMPLIPTPIIGDVLTFASDVNAAYYCLLRSIADLRPYPQWSGPWILVNAWAIFDRFSEQPLLGDYTENTHPLGHPLNNVVAAAALNNNIDVVFAAGNCGQFCPAPRCGALDRGPGRSIWGANSSSAVITVGAVLTNDLWLGYSSQGPGQRVLGSEKPDLCAPSQFHETMDAHVLNTGTSTACGLTAGVVATLRRHRDPVSLTPGALKQILIDTARRTQGPMWNERLGHGVLNAADAFARLSNGDAGASVLLARMATGQPTGSAARTADATVQLSTAMQPSWLTKMTSRFTALARSLLRG